MDPQEVIPESELDIENPDLERNLEILADARKALYSSSSGWDWILQRIRDDIEFASGRQWDPATESARDGRPNLVIDKTRKFIEKVIGAYRQDPPGVKVYPHSSGNKLTAAIYEDYIRRFLGDHRNKGAMITAGEHQALCGYGWMQVSYDYRGENSFELEPKLIRVDDPRSVRIDRSAIETDGSDARWAFRLSRMDKAEAEELYGEGVTSWDSIPQQYVDQWTDDSQVVIADYWWIEEEDDELVEVRLQDGRIKKLFRSELGKTEASEGPDESGEITPEFNADKYPAGSYQEIRSRKAKRRHCYHAVLTGAGVVQSHEWPGPDVPIIPVYGRQAWQDNRGFYTGLIRPAMDAQRLINYFASTIAETTALSPRIPWVVAEGQLEGHEHEWDLQMVKNLPYLQYRQVALNGANAPPPQRTPMAGDVSPLLASMQAATADLTDVTGIYEASLGQETAAAKSGVAVRESSKNSDQVLAVYFDGFRRAIVRTVQVVVRMMPGIVTEETILKVQAEDGKEYSVPVNSDIPMPTQHPAAQGQPVQIDLAEGEYEIALESSQSYSTRRQEMAHASAEMMMVLPDIQKASIAPLVIGAQDWPGAETMARVLKASLPPEIQTAYSEDNTNIDPNAKALLDQAMQQLQQVHGEADQLVQQIQQLQNENQQLQTALLSNERDSQVKLQVAAMNNEERLHETIIKTEGEKAVAQAEKESDTQVAHLNQSGAIIQKHLEAVASTTAAHNQNLKGGPAAAQGLRKDLIRGVDDRVVFPGRK